MTPRHRATNPNHQRFPRWLRTLATIAPHALRLLPYLLDNLTP